MQLWLPTPHSSNIPPLLHKQLLLQLLAYLQDLFHTCIIVVFHRTMLQLQDWHYHQTLSVYQEVQTRTPEDFNAGVKVECTRMHHRPPLHLSNQHLRWKNKNHVWECTREARTRFQSLLRQKKRSQQRLKLCKRRRILQAKLRAEVNEAVKRNLTKGTCNPAEAATDESSDDDFVSPRCGAEGDMTNTTVLSPSGTTTNHHNRKPSTETRTGKASSSRSEPSQAPRRPGVARPRLSSRRDRGRSMLSASASQRRRLSSTAARGGCLTQGRSCVRRART